MKLSMRFWSFSMELDANDKQLDCPFLFASAKAGYAAARSLDDERVEHDSAVRDDPGLYPGSRRRSGEARHRF